MERSVFGYGSLILPHAVVSHISDQVPSVDSIYKNRLRYEEDGIVHDKAQDVLEDEYNRIDFKPVRLRGFIRTYTYESERGGAMLEAYYTGRDNDIVNGVLISGLDYSEQKQITQYEEGYDLYRADPSEFELYDEISDKSIESESTVYLGGNEEYSNWNTSRVRNQTYHSRILRGIDYLGEQYGSELRDDFWSEFVENTYEHPATTLEISYEQLNNF